MDTNQRAALFAALGDPIRLAIADDLMSSDRSPGELADRHGQDSNLLAHHLGVLEDAGVISRTVSAGDRRRRYVRIRHEALGHLRLGPAMPDQPILFVCTQNSARSQLAAALWSDLTGAPAESAGTRPAAQVHPEAIRAAARAGLDLSAARPRQLTTTRDRARSLITVCDQAHEQIDGSMPHWHWSTPDPVADPTPGSFDDALERLKTRISLIAGANAR